ncbi:protein virD3 (plasmid) [Agrobacterium fabrum]|uniref:Protein VirD3 n=5 Tax=Rhizobium/Agrobacterium group TaxID=227290 RepID=VIRD3_AGRFC|nr:MULTISPECIES: protein virD3 [Agrobacterium tumefaciens complex]P18593.2 RecName: Full=Protein VirD3 [Agrobacterium fabrum str. C58]ASK42359.1 protein virD3 [Agrobacterium sp.]AAK90945.2 virA/G regulated protein [Agrobacterium fabrum str. C58]ASK42713.1 protein virD3 [Agrobacterium fabrum str. C58]ASK43386.1 protein virD3 [Agrobacterium fabrum]ASK45256.1 protein virD3 [Agrobacterium tumefaciens]
MANEEFTRHYAWPVPVASNDEGRGTARIPIQAQSIVAGEDGRDTSVPTALSRPPIEDMPHGVQETSASGGRLGAARLRDSVIPPGISEARTDLSAILRKKSGSFRTGMQYLRGLERENFDKQDREASALPDLSARGIKRPREIEYPGNASGLTIKRQDGLGIEINTISASSPVNRAAHSSNWQGAPEPGVYNVQPSADRAQNSAQESSTFPDGTSVSALYSGPLAEWFERDTGSETTRNSGNTISSPLRGLEEFGDSADSRYLGREAQSLSVTVTTPNSNAEASSHSAHTETLDDVSSDRSSEQGRGPLGAAILGSHHDLSPRAQKLSQTNRDSPELTDADLAKVDAVFESLSKGPPAGESAAPDFRERGPGSAFQKEGVSDRANGVPTNWEVPFGRGGGHSPQALRSSGVELDDFPDFTEAELAKIDALVESHSNRSLSVRNIVPDLRGAGADNVFRKEGVVERAEKMPIDSVSLTRLNGERSRSPKTSQASLEDFPDLTDADLAHIEESERIARTAVEKGKQKISTEADTRFDLGNSSAPRVSPRSVTPLVPNANQPITSWFYEAQKTCDKLVENTYVKPAVDSSRARNDVENTAARLGDPAPALGHDNLGRTRALTPVRDVMSRPSADRQLASHAAEHSAIDDIWKRDDRDRRTHPYRGLDSRSREGCGR